MNNNLAIFLVDLGGEYVQLTSLWPFGSDPNAVQRNGAQPLNSKKDADQAPYVLLEPTPSRAPAHRAQMQ